jgi:ABC-type cobalamin/Fe3+-siderophores transport system ATPase subunit
VAVDEVSFEVNDDEIFGLIGPNGAGKTTTMECIEGLRKPDRGTIAVLGLDPLRQAPGVTAVNCTDMRFTISGRGDDLVTEVIHCLSRTRSGSRISARLSPILKTFFSN